jgi:hypothetical protein
MRCSLADRGLLDDRVLADENLDSDIVGDLLGASNHIVRV